MKYGTLLPAPRVNVLSERNKSRRNTHLCRCVLQSLSFKSSHLKKCFSGPVELVIMFNITFGVLVSCKPTENMETCNSILPTVLLQLESQLKCLFTYLLISLLFFFPSIHSL